MALETVPGLTAVGWMGMVAPRGTPEPIVRQLSRDLRKVFEKPEIVAKRPFVEAAARARRPNHRLPTTIRSG